MPDALVRHVEGASCPHRHARDSTHGSRVHVSELAGKMPRCSEQSDGARPAAKEAAEGRGARARLGLLGRNEAKAQGPGRRSLVEKIAQAILCTRISGPVSKAARRGVPMGEQAGAGSTFVLKCHGYPSLTSAARMAGRFAQGIMDAQRERAGQARKWAPPRRCRKMATRRGGRKGGAPQWKPRRSIAASRAPRFRSGRVHESLGLGSERDLSHMKKRGPRGGSW
jgi:hypothetical protein